MMDFDWDDAFKNPVSWPTQTLGMSRDVFEKNKMTVLSCANRYGYTILGATRADPHAVSYHANCIEFIRQHGKA